MKPTLPSFRPGRLMRVGLLAGAALALPILTASAATTTVLVLPADVGLAPGEWHEVSRSGASSVITGTQADSQGGTGSTEQTLPAVGSPSPKTDFQLFSADTGLVGSEPRPLAGGFGLLSDMDELSFEWFRDSASTVAGHFTPAFRLWLWDPAATTSYYVIWEGVYNGYPSNGPAAPTDVWVAEDLLTDNFWRIPQFSNGVFQGISFCNSNPSLCFDFDNDLGDWAFGAGTVVFGIEMGLGSGWNGTFHGFVDFPTIGFNGDSTAWDFELLPPPAPPEFTLRAKVGGGNVINENLPEYVVDTWATKNVTVYLGCEGVDSPIDIFRGDKAVTFKDGIHYYSTEPTDECIDENGLEAAPIVDYGPIKVDTKAPVCKVTPSTIYINRQTTQSVSFDLDYSDATSGVVEPIAPPAITVTGGATLNGTSGPDSTTFNVTMGTSTAGRVEATWTITDNAGLSTTCKAIIRAK